MIILITGIDKWLTITKPIEIENQVECDRQRSNRQKQILELDIRNLSSEKDKLLDAISKMKEINRTDSANYDKTMPDLKEKYDEENDEIINAQQQLNDLSNMVSSFSMAIGRKTWPTLKG